VVEVGRFQDLVLVDGDVAQGHAPIATPDSLPQVQEEPQGRRVVVIGSLEVQDNVLDTHVVEASPNILRPSLDLLVVHLNQVRHRHDDERVVLLPGLEETFLPCVR
jgi:hypothetical protein